MTDTDLQRAAEAWLAEDPDPQTRAELGALLDAAATDPVARAALADRFTGPLRFGTAGLRGALGAGPNRMNRVVVIRAAAGLAAYLRERAGASVVVGFDARRNSDVFARDTAAVMEGAGIRAMVLSHPLPTPVLAFAIRHLATDAGVMVTASHNPRQDSGYKVYLGDGAQIAPPADEEISALINAVGPLALVPRGEEWVTLGDEVVDAYVAAVARLSLVADAAAKRSLRLAYTPLHGVGRDVLMRVLDCGGFAPPAVVAEQADPDPEFPTVASPNPEEPGGLDRLIALAASCGADVALANDPDADRLAVVAGGRRLSGDEVGALLAEHVLAHTNGADRLVVTTIVSSSLLSRIAAAHGVRYAETLTGFKWIVKAGDLGDRFVFGYEEALGYCLGGWSDADAGPPVRDKDGIGAALVVAELAASLYRDGRTFDDALDDLARRHGLHVTDQWSLRTSRHFEIATAMAALRADPPTVLAGREVTAIEDLADGVGGLPPADGLRLRVGSDPARPARVVVRPSGTEPKLKAYFEVVVPVAGSLADARARARDDLRALREALAALLSRDPGVTICGRGRVVPVNRADLAAIVDHTLLRPEATPADVEQLCVEAVDLGVFAVCVSPSLVPVAARALASTDVAVATVCGFPSGAHHPAVKAREAELAAECGAREVDMVVDLGLTKAGDWAGVEQDVREVRRVLAHQAMLKVIVESAALADEEIVAVCRAAEREGADFVKTSTGFHPAGGASVAAVRLMADTVGGRLGVKASGGIRTAEAAIAMVDAGATRLGLSHTRVVLDGLPG